MDGNKAQSWLIIIIIHQLLWANHSRLQQQVQPCPCIFNESSPTCVEGTWNTPSLPMFWCMFRYIILATDPGAYILPPGTSTTPSGESRHLYYCGEWCDSPGGEELGEKARGRCTEGLIDMFYRFVIDVVLLCRSSSTTGGFCVAVGG